MLKVEQVLGREVWRYNMFGLNKIKSISTDELERIIKNPRIQLIDVRETHEFVAGHIKGARNIPLGQIETFVPTSKVEVYLICQSGMRSRRAYKILNKKGINVTNVTRGMSAWSGKVVR